MQNIESEIRNHPFLAGLRPAHVNVICATAEQVEFEPGSLILREREPAAYAYLLTSGKVEIAVHSRASGRTLPVDTLQAGDVFGWSWLFAPFCWHFQARALERVQAIALDGAALLVRCEEDHELGYLLMKRMTQLLIRRLDAARRTIIKLDQANAPMDAQPSLAQGKVNA